MNKEKVLSSDFGGTFYNCKEFTSVLYYTKLWTTIAQIEMEKLYESVCKTK